MFGPAKRYDPPGKRDACRAYRSSAVQRARTQASQVRTFPFAPTATFLPDAPPSGSPCAEYPLRQNNTGEAGGEQHKRPEQTRRARRGPAHTQNLPPQIGSPRSQRRSVYKGAINPRFPSTSRNLSRTLGRQVSPRVCWQCRTSGQRGLIPPSISSTRTRTRLRNNIPPAASLRNTGLRGRRDVDYRGAARGPQW